MIARRNKQSNIIRFFYSPILICLFYVPSYLLLFLAQSNILAQAADFSEGFDLFDIYSQFPLNLTTTLKKNILEFTTFLKSLKSQTPINPYTGRPVFIAAVVNLAQYDLAMNFLCSLSQVQTDPKTILLITVDEESYTIYKRYNFSICYLNLSSCKFEYYVLVKVKIIILKILLKLNYELLVTDIDIAYFEPFQQYLYLPQIYDIGFWYECGTPDVNPRTLPWYINTGFIRMFPSTRTLRLLDAWIYENNNNLKMGNQKPLQELMRLPNKTRCRYILKNDHFFLNLKNDSNRYYYKGYWRCTIFNYTDLIWHIFPERKMLSGCEAVTRKIPMIVDFRNKNISAGMLHLICVSGGRDKGRFLNSSGLWFYDTRIKQCIRDKAIQRWKVIFTKFNESFFITPYKPTLYTFPTIHTKANLSKYTIVDDVINWSLSK